MSAASNSTAPRLMFSVGQWPNALICCERQYAVSNGAMANHPALWRVLTSIAVALAVAGVSNAAAQTAASRRNAEPTLRTDNVLFFGGVFSKGNLQESLTPFYPHERNYLVGAAYARDFRPLIWGFNLGGEVGYAARFGDDRGSSEFWVGPVIRHRGFPIGNAFILAPALVLGLSAVTAPIGIESDREAKHNGSSSVLFRFSPELAFRPTASPNFELVYRIHHRSGLYGTIGGLKKGSNAHVFGLRWFRWNHGGFETGDGRARTCDMLPP